MNAPLRDAVRAEWTKLRTLPGTGWLLLGMVAATVIISATVPASLGCTSTAGCHVDVTKLSLTGTYLGQAIVARQRASAAHRHRTPRPAHGASGK